MRILITNDDGIDAPGILALHEAARPFGELLVVAPADVQSAASHTVTFRRPLRVSQRAVRGPDGRLAFEGYAVDGAPADCTKVALTHFVERPVDLVLSGINGGCNVGIHTFYSGTVAAAREAAICGVPAVAFSLHIGDRERVRWERAAALARDFLAELLEQPLPARMLLNVNFPILDAGGPLGRRVTHVATTPMVDAYRAEPAGEGGPGGPGDPRDRLLFATDHVAFHAPEPDSDVDLLFRRFVTVTPLHVDPTHHHEMPGWTDRLRLDRLDDAESGGAAERRP